MTWHAIEKCTEPGKMQHPVDGRAWKNFDTNYPNFAKEPRNVRLGLADDGFISFGNLSQAYSMWSVMLTTYNLPPWLCMKESSFMLTLLIHGPKSSGKDVDVYLRPLIADLKVLWALKGVETIDVATGQKFNMRAVVLWTMNDFSAQSSLFGWSGQGYNACPTCNEDTPYQYLPDEVAKPIIEPCSFFKQTCSATLMEDDTLKAQSKVVDILCNLELIFPPAFYDIMIHLVIHLPLEDLEGGPIRPRWMFPFERFMKKLKGYVRNKAKLEGSIPEGYVAEEALTFSSHYFRDVTMKFNRLDRNVDPPSPTCQFQIRQCQVDNDPGVSATSELFALACGPTPTPISVNSCVVNGVRSVVHSRDERHTTQNSGICSPGEKHEEMYYEDDDIIDDEDALPHDLADSDDEDLVNVDDDDGVDMSTDVARGHGGDGGGDDRPPTHHIPTGKGTRKPNLGGRKAGRLHTRQETRNLGLKKITDDKGPVLIQFEWDDKKTLMPLGDHASHWSNYLGELIRKMPLYYPSWQKVSAERKAAIVTKIETQFDLKPNMQSQRWTDINAGIQQHLQKLYNTNKASLKAAHWVINPETGTYDVESIRQRRPENITLADWDAQTAFWNDLRNQALAAQNRQNWAKSTVVCRQGSRSLARLRDQMMESSATREYPSLIHTFFVTHTVNGVFTRDDDRAIYTEEEINALARKGKQRGHLPGVGRVLPGWATDVLGPPPPQCTHNSVDVEKLKKKNKCGDDEMSDDEDGGEDEEDEEDGDRASGYRQVKVLEFFDCSGPRQGVEDLRGLLHKGAQGDREAGVFHVSKDDTVVAQRQLKDKQPEEKTNTNCLVYTTMYEECGRQTFGVVGIQQQNGLVDETNVTLCAKNPIDMLEFFGWLVSIKQWMLEPVKVKCIFLGYHKSIVGNKLWRLDDVTSKVVLYRNIGFNESGEYKKTFIGSGVGTGSMQVLHEFEFEVKPLGDHTFEVEPQENIDQGAGLREVQTQNLMNYQFALEKSYAHESLTFNNTVACEVIFKWKVRLKDDMDARSDVYVLSNGCRKCSDDSDGYSWGYTPGYGLMILGCAGSLKANLQHMKALSTTEVGYMTFTEAWKKKIWLKGLLTESRYELSLVACIATGALVKGGSRSEVPVQVKVAAYRY
uniref:DUF4218 domain-containing protein n=1 Tax=Tanacetum cinerariifolium TaxID=118510 RepID=A0A6L2LQX7_TANCI|nr:hypothetical protein [Tanacetum cinerariifolium]